MQRCGTKSFGDFFRKNGLRVWSWRETEKYNLGERVFEGDWINIISSGVFNNFDVFEDAPFYHPIFAKFLSKSAENSKFIYFHRPASDWYDSMVTHSNGMTLGVLRRHAFYYDRLEDLNYLRENGLERIKKLGIIGLKNHYENLYTRHRYQISELFSGVNNSRFFSCSLYDKNKFKLMSDHFSLSFSDTAEVKSHATKTSVKEVLLNHKHLFI